ncbi:MAG: uroporphyrinogen decarboxylase family protein [Acidobacteriia bacterium]|nr:uroporphyrinogen decarboxylase family protein [Terriglobia bacterium]
MPDQETPRRMLKALVRGESLARPLLLPVVFSLASRLESQPLRDFLKNPTKIANALRQIRSTLKIDGLTCYWDPFLEIEALGGNAEWKSDGSRTFTRPTAMDLDGLRQTVEASGGISKMGRIRVAVEVLQRLKVMLKDEPALMVRVTGPHTLAAQLTAPSSPPPDSPPDDVLEFAAEVTSSLVKGYLEAGADVVILTESTLPAKSPGDFERWRTLLDPVVNVIRFFEALPVVLFEDAVSPEELALVREEHSWDCAICLPLQGGPASDWQGVAPWLGMSMQGLDVARSEDEFGKWATSILETVSASHASFLTSSDLPAASDLRSLAKNLSTIQGHLISAA